MWAGMVVKLEPKCTFWLRMDAGYGTNTRPELLALWGLLHFASKRHICDLQVMGDSRDNVDWDLGIHNIHSMELSHWLSSVKGLFCHFNNLHFHHIYREYNYVANDISKRAIGLGGGKIAWE